MVSPIQAYSPTMRSVAAEAQVAALGQAVLSTPSTVLPHQKDTIVSVAGNTSPSFWQKVKHWFVDVFKIGGAEARNAPAVQEAEAAAPPLDGHIPRLTPPEALEQKKVAKALTELHDYLQKISDFESEMNRSDENIEKLIFLRLVYSGLQQKVAKEESGQFRILEVHQRQQQGKELQDKYYNHIEEIQRCEKQLRNLRWVNAAITGATLTGFAVSIFLTGGLAALGIAVPMAATLKGVSSGTNALHKHTVDQETGNLGVVQLGMKNNSNKIEEELRNLQAINSDVAALYKAIKELLKAQREAQKAIIQN